MWTGIELLHILQDIRMDFPFLEDLCLAMSSRAVYMVIPVLLIMSIYWLFDREKGEIIILGCLTAVVTSSIVKLLVAMERPWALDPEIYRVPGAGDAGFSLPSGHTTMSVSSYIPAAWYFRKKAVLAALMAMAAVLIGMSRLILCVHTPLDVITSIAISAAMVLLAFKAVEIGKRSERAYYSITAAYVIPFTVLALYACLYREADLQEILPTTGAFYGLMIGRIIEHRYIGYTVKERTGGQKIKAYAVGILAAGVIFGVPMAAIPAFGTFIGGMLLMIWCYALYPMVMMKRDI